MKTMRRLTLTGAIGALVGAALLAVPSAQAGGGCRGMPVTESETTIVTIEYGTCYEPTIVRVAQGSTVKWENPADGLPHTITGANTSWGDYGEISPGVSVSYDFPDAGVYPYFCFLHPGMVGAVVVGDQPEGAVTENVSSIDRSLSLVSDARVSPARGGGAGSGHPRLIVTLSVVSALGLACAGFALGRI